ncbi:MAG: hypothetical protein EAX86_03385 [Candidatus Heimdallarchaeota archaeon]|nr:hypothetical protein [Candidatus Heimdallarchaeota archaeon]
MGFAAIEKKISSVGIDIGTSTSHLIFSELTLRKDPNSRTEKYFVSERTIKYRGTIFFTPLKGLNNEIDVDRLIQQFLQEYENAGVKVTDVDTGACIITGESAKKENAEKIVNKLAKEAGKFVASTAGPNFEAIISAYGSGAVNYSKENQCFVIHTDVGGGTSNIAVINDGQILSTACINVGGRLIAFDDNNIITRLEPAGEMILKECNINSGLGKSINEEQKSIIARKLADSLLEVISDKNISEITQKLMMTPLIPKEHIQKNHNWSFSGGVAEYIYQKTKVDYQDIGLNLGQTIRTLMFESNYSLIEAPEKIRATVIGASEYTLQVSGSTTFMSKKIPRSIFPIRNLPIVTPQIDREALSIEYVKTQIISSLQRLDITEGDETIALAFHDPVRTVYDKLAIFGKGIVSALPKTIAKNKTIILVFDTDCGNSVGNVLIRETGITNNVISIDEISLKEGDFIDIGEPIVEDRVFPVVIKSLVFG